MYVFLNILCISKCLQVRLLLFNCTTENLGDPSENHGEKPLACRVYSLNGQNRHGVEECILSILFTLFL